MPSSTKYVLPVFFLIVFLGAIVLGPLIYFGLGGIVPFHRAMDRALLVSAVGALIVFRSRISLSQLWHWNSDAWKSVLLGYVLAFISVQAMIGLDLALSGFTLASLSIGQIAMRVLLALLAAILVPIIEETVFRGFLQTELISSLGQKWGWVLAAFIFMLAHFLKIPVELDREPVHIWSGLNALGAAFLPVVQGAFLCGKGINLFLIGLILGGIFLRSGTLWMAAGLHSGWILAVLLFPAFTRPMEPPYVAFFEGDLLSNPITTVVLMLLSAWLWRFYLSPYTAPGSGDDAP